jgi:nucleoside 2-deoxyribosyltransferase
MKIFVATSYSSKVDYATGRVFPEYRDFLEHQLAVIEQQGNTVFIAIRADGYRINNDDQAAAYRLDLEEIRKCDVLIAFLDEKVSAGVQTEIGIALAFGKRVLLARPAGVEPEYFNQALVRAGVAREIALPLNASSTATFLAK